MTRYIVGFLLAVGLIIVVIVLIIKALIGGPKPSSPQDLTTYADTGTTVQLTIDSPVKASDKHNDIIINIGNTQSVLQVTKGYEGEVVRRQSYPMNTNAYTVFLRALNFNGFTSGNNDPNLQDERGHCATGIRYIYEIIDENGNAIQHYWSSSCGMGTFKGNANVVQQLFEDQIPDYNSLTSDVSL